MKKNQKGFTLVELLVSTAIIALMSALFFANYRHGGVGVDLSGTVHKLASDIRVAQNYSLGTKKFNGVTPSGGWGVHFDLANNNKQYIVFADTNGDYKYEPEEKYSTYNISANILISSTTQSQLLDLVFLPPDPRTYINGNYKSSVDIVLQEELNHTTKKIEINFLGLIDIID
ncbi:MAG: prepilin-type N-terminal cleavage/methylation domain-containing protein [Candidatus Falkowbacteria bacterium]|nr:prepilin-type N-terminal cleavage/methylation domain-containing protein [Candidatus Falkowbacteria bacterium]